MSSFFPNGSRYSVSTTLAAASAITAASNAAEAVMTTGTAPADGSVIVLSNGWAGANNRVFVTANGSGTSFKLAGYDSSDLVANPAASGAGSFRVASGWVDLTQIREVNFTGGEQQYFTYTYIEDPSRAQRKKPTFKNAKSFEMTLDYDPAMPWYNQLIALDLKATPVVLRVILPNGATLYYNVFPAFDADPKQTSFENMTNDATFALIAASNRYEAVGA